MFYNLKKKNYWVKHTLFPKFGSSVGLFGDVLQLCPHNIVITTNFDILKYIKKDI